MRSIIQVKETLFMQSLEARVAYLVIAYRIYVFLDSTLRTSADKTTLTFLEVFIERHFTLPPAFPFIYPVSLYVFFNQLFLAVGFYSPPAVAFPHSFESLFTGKMFNPSYQAGQKGSSPAVASYTPDVYPFTMAHFGQADFNQIIHLCHRYSATVRPIPNQCRIIALVS
jgi:hypothetical protein